MRGLPRAVPPGPGGHVMRSWRIAVVLLAFLVLAVLPVAAAAPPGYVALGDSVDFGTGSSTGAGCAVPDLVALGDASLEALPGSAIMGGGLNWRLRAAAARQGAKVIELFFPFASFGDLALVGDCIHPSDFGYSLIVDQAIAAFIA